MKKKFRAAPFYRVEQITDRILALVQPASAAQRWT